MGQIGYLSYVGWVEEGGGLAAAILPVRGSEAHRDEPLLSIINFHLSGKQTSP